MSTQRVLSAVFTLMAFVGLPASAFGQEVGVKAGINSASLTPLEGQDRVRNRVVSLTVGVRLR